MTKKETTTAVMDEELIQAVLRECDALDEADDDTTNVEDGDSRKKTEAANASINESPTNDGLPAIGHTPTAPTHAPEADLDDPIVPEAAMPTAAIPWHRLDHRAGYLLRHVDGHRTITEIIAQSGIEAQSARPLLQDLLDQGCIKFP